MVVRPPSTKSWDMRITLPVPDLQAIEPPADAVDDEDVSGTIWPHVERAVLAHDANRPQLLGRIAKLRSNNDIERFADDLSEFGAEVF